MSVTSPSRRPSSLENKEPQSELMALLQPLITHKWLILLTAVVTTAGAFFWSVRQPKIYQADCTVEYIPNPPRPLGQKIEDISNPFSYWSDREYFATQNLIIASRAVAERVARKLGLVHDEEFMQLNKMTPEEKKEAGPKTLSDAAELVQEALSVTPERNTRLVHVAVEDTDPERAALIANTVAEEYIEKAVEDRLGSTTTALDWLGRQLDGLKQQLENSELALHEFKEKNQALSISLEDRQNLVAADIQRYSEALTRARTQRIQLSSRLQALREANDKDPAAVHAAIIDEAPTVARLREQLSRALSERSALATEYGEAHPRMQVVSAEIEVYKEELRKEIDGVIRRAEVDLLEVEQVEHGLRKALNEANAAGMSLNLQEIEYRRLSRERDNTAELYATILERTAETDLTRALKVEYAQIVDRAVSPDKAVKPRLIINLALGLVLGTLLGCGLAVLASQMDRRLRTAEAVEALGLTVLGLLPQIESSRLGANARKGRNRRNKGASPERDLFVHYNPKSPVAECCRTVRTNLTFSSADHPYRALLVTSASPREGKTTVSLSLAISLAQSGKRVLLVDTDLRKPRTHRALGLRSSPGVTSLLVSGQDPESVVQQTEVPGLFFLGSGPIPPNPSELLHTEQFGNLINACKEHYDLVLFDSPPLTAVTDAAIIAPQVDGTLFVIHAERTTRDSLQSALRQLRDVNANLVGGVLNDVNLGSQRYGRGSYYYYSRGEGYYGSDAESQDDGGDDTEDRSAAES